MPGAVCARANDALDSPYFHPGFAAAVHGIGHDVVVAVARGTDGSPTMLLPVQVQRGVARPAGWPGVDFQAPIAAPGTAVDAAALLRPAGGVRSPSTTCSPTRPAVWRTRSRSVTTRRSST